mmetsp:Transcript_28597/g.62572  ORF Transcript_28597/g.62572 Transcript_28597/m.62572 type:complete len:233 (+) Transcript_28597:157-855(+)
MSVGPVLERAIQSHTYNKAGSRFDTEQDCTRIGRERITAREAAHSPRAQLHTHGACACVCVPHRTHGACAHACGGAHSLAEPWRDAGGHTGACACLLSDPSYASSSLARTCTPTHARLRTLARSHAQSSLSLPISCLTHSHIHSLSRPLRPTLAYITPYSHTHTTAAHSTHRAGSLRSHTRRRSSESLGSMGLSRVSGLSLHGADAPVSESLVGTTSTAASGAVPFLPPLGL